MMALVVEGLLLRARGLWQLWHVAISTFGSHSWLSSVPVGSYTIFLFWSHCFGLRLLLAESWVL